jgi:hypothetical protein
MTADELLRQLPLLSPAEKAKFRRGVETWLSAEVADVRGIVATAGVCGGSARVAGTRIPVWSLVQK